MQSSGIPDRQTYQVGAASRHLLDAPVIGVDMGLQRIEDGLDDVVHVDFRIVHMEIDDRSRKTPVESRGFRRPSPEGGVKHLPLPSLSRSEEHTSELQSLMRISYAVFCFKKKKPPLTLAYSGIEITQNHDKISAGHRRILTHLPERPNNPPPLFLFT